MDGMFMVGDRVITPRGDVATVISPYTGRAREQFDAGAHAPGVAVYFLLMEDGEVRRYAGIALTAVGGGADPGTSGQSTFVPPEEAVVEQADQGSLAWGDLEFL